MSSHNIDENRIVYANLSSEEGVVLNLNSKNYYRLNESAQMVWQGITQGDSKETIINLFCEAYDIDRLTAQQDINGLIEQLKQEELIS